MVPQVPAVPEVQEVLFSKFTRFRRFNVTTGERQMHEPCERFEPHPF